MNKLASIFLLSFVAGLAQCFPVTPGGTTSLQVFFCISPGCASNVTQVFCNDQSVFSHIPIVDCTDLPPPNSVCQHEGRAFVSIDTPGSCDFEGGNYIRTEKCTDQTSVCDFTSATTSPVTTKSAQDPQLIPIICCVICVVIIGLVPVVAVFLHFCKKAQNGENNQQPDSDVSVPLREMQCSTNSVRDTQDDWSRRDNGTFSQPDPGA